MSEEAGLFERSGFVGFLLKAVVFHEPLWCCFLDLRDVLVFLLKPWVFRVIPSVLLLVDRTVV